jgi:hypothetical protein
MTTNEAKARKKLEALLWKHTHRDFRGKLDDGSKTVLMGTAQGTVSVCIARMTDAEIIAKLPRSIREMVTT